jgi:hypothetical protein
VFEHAPQALNADQGWDPAILAKSAMGLTIDAHAAMFAGQSIVKISKKEILPVLEICCAEQMSAKCKTKARNLVP